MKARFRILPSVFALLIGLASASVSRANAIVWNTFNPPTTGVAGNQVVIGILVTNPHHSNTDWGENHYLALRDSTGNVVGLHSLDYTPTGQQQPVSFAFTVPAVTGNQTYTVTALEHEVEYFGEPQEFTVAVSSRADYVKVYLSTATFDRFAPAKISTTNSSVLDFPGYRLRAKVIDSTAWGWHAANLWNTNDYPLDNPPPPGNYSTVALYWVRYHSLYGSVTEVGPEWTLPVSVRSGVTLSKTWFHASSPARISTGDNMGTAPYRLYATFRDGRGNAWETTSGNNNTNTPLANLPPPGTYLVDLYWKTFDSNGATTATGAVRTETVNLVAGPVSLLPAGTGDSITWGSTEIDGEEVWGYSDWFSPVISVTQPGLLKVRGYSTTAGVNDNQVYLNLRTESGVQLRSGIPEIEMQVEPGTYRVNVTAGQELAFAVTADLYPLAPAPTITSGAEAVGGVGVEFSGYTVTTSTAGVVTFTVPAAGSANALPPGLTMNSATGAITGTPTTAGTYNVLVTAANAGGSTSKTVTFTVVAPPGKPQYLSTSTMGATSIYVAWAPPSGALAAASYRVEVNDVLAGTVSVPYLTLTGLLPATLYNLKVRAVSAAGTMSQWSDSVMAATAPTGTPGSTDSVWIETPHILRDQNGQIVSTNHFDGLLDEVVATGPGKTGRFSWVDVEPIYSISFGGYSDPFDVNDFWSYFNSNSERGSVPGMSYVFPQVYVDLAGLSASMEARFKPTKVGEIYQIYEDQTGSAIFNPLGLTRKGGEYTAENDTEQSFKFPGYELLWGSRPAFYLVRKGNAIASTMIALPGPGSTIIGIRNPSTLPSTGPIKIGDWEVDIGVGGGSIKLPNGGTISVSGGVVSVQNIPGLPNGPLTGTVTVGGLGTVEVDTAGNVTVAVATGVPVLGGATIRANAGGGGSIDFPNGSGISVSTTGKMSVRLPPGTNPVIVQVKDILEKVLSVGAGAVITVRDILGTLPGVPLPTSGPLGAIDAAIIARGAFQIGVKLGDDKWFWFDVYVGPTMAVDANRDGAIAFDSTDVTSAAVPYRFWVNDDDDGNAFNQEQEVSASTAKDYESRGDFGIASKRDLEDFARLWINGAGIIAALKNGDLQLGLRWKADTVTGAPAINLYRHYETDGGTGYLTDNATAIQQTAPPYSTTLVDATGRNVVSATNGVFVFKQEFFAGLSDSQPKSHLLFEGAGIGKGLLQIVVLDRNGAQIGEGSGVWLDLKSVQSMYQRVKVTPRDPIGIPKPYRESTTFDASTTGTELFDGGFPFQAAPDEAHTALVFVHGSNIAYEEARWNAETMFKRLYWQGYKGRFVLFYWDTLVGVDTGLPDPLGQIPALPYNLNEYRALKFGPALKNYVANVAQGRTVNVTSHSLGAGVVLSALKAGMAVNNYLILQGAYSAKSYNVALPTLQRFQDAEAEQPTPDLATILGYGGYLANVQGTVINMFNPDDFALATGSANLNPLYPGAAELNWERNQEISKPDDPFGVGQYNYVTQQPAGYNGPVPLGGSVYYSIFQAAIRPVTDPHESMAFIARTRTKAVGALAGVGGIVSQEVQLNNTTYNFGATRSDHSAEFTRTVQQTDAFYQRMFDSVGATP